MISKKALTRKVFQDPHYFTAFGFGSGLLAPAPGTWGTLAAIPLYLLMTDLSAYSYMTICILAFAYGCWACHKVSTELQVHDYKGIVWDEVVGYWLTMFLIPYSISALVLGFFLFRFFDILKPPPIRWIDKHVHGGIGIMLDDVLAAVPAWLILYLLTWTGIL